MANFCYPKIIRNTLTFLIFFSSSIGYTTPISHNNNPQRGALLQTTDLRKAHYRGEVSAKFREAQPDESELKGKFNSAFNRIRQKLLQRKRTDSNKEIRYSLVQCAKSRVRNEKKTLPRKRSAIGSKLDIDILFYDAEDPLDARAAEIWPYKTAPIDGSAFKKHLRHLAKVFKVHCLPSRVIWDKRGLLVREGNTAWRITKKDLKHKELFKEIKQLRSSRRH
ncbi:MAG: hypothetical protein D6808_03610 [Candidatus Dadabacteria bacterium]|nr:MAG: hypothetical protein D6808_03610 [Candidatus Dadabacteria bacterium]